jgi:hypothetical protein
MKRLCLTLGLLAIQFTMGLQAQVLDSRADIPFAFWLGQKLMPAGAYSIFHLASGAVLLKGEGKNQNMTSVVFLGLPASRPETDLKGKLEFNRYGDTYFLSEVWNPNHRDGCSVQKSNREKELASRSIPSPGREVAVATK